MFEHIARERAVVLKPYVVHLNRRQQGRRDFVLAARLLPAVGKEQFYAH